MAEPDRTRPTVDRSVRTVVNGFSFLESPRWRDGRLYVSDFYLSQVYACTEDGGCEAVCEVGGQPSGLGFTPEGDLLVVSRLNKTLSRLGAAGLEVVADLGDATGVLNDMVVDESGRAYIGACVLPDDEEQALGTQIFRVDPDGTCIVVAEDVVFPNGMVITPDAGTLLVAETFTHRISAYGVEGGRLFGRRVWKDFAAPDGVFSTSRVAPGSPVLPDGLAMDEEGAVWVADAHGSAAIRVAEDGTVLDTVSTGDYSVYAVALGGADRQTLFLCVAAPFGTEDPANTRHSSLLASRVDVPGAGLP